MEKAILGGAKQQLRETNKKVLLQSFVLINGAFALVAALAWNEAIKAAIDRYFKAGSGIYSKFAYAIILTAIIVIVTNKLSKIMNRLEPEELETKNE